MADYSYEERKAEIIREEFIKAGGVPRELAAWRQRPSARDLWWGLGQLAMCLALIGAGWFVWWQIRDTRFEWLRFIPGVLFLGFLGLPPALFTTGAYLYRLARSEWRRRTGSVPAPNALHEWWKRRSYVFWEVVLLGALPVAVIIGLVVKFT